MSDIEWNPLSTEEQSRYDEIMRHAPCDSEFVDYLSAINAIIRKFCVLGEAILMLQYNFALADIEAIEKRLALLKEKVRAKL